MKVIRPTDITDALLVSSTVAEPETGWPAYNAATPYADKAHVTVAAVHRKYEAIGAVAAGNYPPDTPTKWLDKGPTLRWAMFDDEVGTDSTNTGSIIAVLQPGSADALAVLDCDAELVNVKMTVGSTDVYDQTQSTNVGGAAITDWFTYFFEPIGKRTALTFMDLPVYPSATVTVTLTGANPAGPVNCGTLIIGRQLDLGETQNGADIGIEDYSVKTTNGYGGIAVVERPYSKQMTVEFTLPAANVDTIQRELAYLRAKACLWVGDPAYDCTIIFGFYTDQKLKLINPTSEGSLTIQGLSS
jgi:hypothetical protein